VTPRRRDRLLTARIARWLDQRLGGASFARTALEKVFPDHWSFMIGEIALYCFVILVVTGVYLTFFFAPSSAPTVYQGSYAPLRGVEMAEAYRSALDISFDVRAGLVMRQMHHWASLLFAASVVVHLCRVFFTGAFRRPRELNWMVGVTLLVLVIANGFMGYSLLEDQLSGTGLRIAYSIALSVPLVGTWITSLVFGGEFPGSDIIERLYVLHILILPAVIAALITVHLAVLVRQRHTQFRGKGRDEGNVVGERMWPTYAAKALGLFFLTAAVLAALGGLAQINPVWVYGPFDPAEVSSASQPDWYMGWLDGALRLMPGWEVRAFGFEVPNPFFPGVLLPGLTFTLLYLWPFLEARATGDHHEHHLLDRPRERPLRTALGVATLTFYTVLTFGGGADVLAVTFGLSVNAIFWTFRALLFVLPPVTAWVAYRLCRELVLRDRLPPAQRDHVGRPAPAAPSSGEELRRRHAPDGEENDDQTGGDVGPTTRGAARPV
jgi:ubiquinol-cytochrome c reductase cytochrome b subunit